VKALTRRLASGHCQRLVRRGKEEWGQVLAYHSFLAEQSTAPDCLQRPLRSRFRQQVSASVMPPQFGEVAVSEIMESNYAQMKSYLERNKFPFTEGAEQNCKRIDVQHGKATCAVKIFSTGTIQLSNYRR
jgi:hypothetical protein